MVIDVGSSKVRAGLVSLKDGRTLVSRGQDYGWQSPVLGWLEIDPEVIWACIENSLNAVFNEYDLSSVHIIAAAFSYIGDNLLLMGSDMKPLYPMMCSGDNRASGLLKHYGEGSVLGQEFERISGAKMDETYVPLKLHWFREYKPEILDKCSYIFSLQQFVLTKLGLPPVYDFTMAGRSMLIDLGRKSWAEGFLNGLGLSSEKMGELLPSSTAIGNVEYIGNVKLPDSIPVIIGAHDAACAYMGLGSVPCDAPDLIAESAGTWDLMGYISSQYRPLRNIHIGLGPNGCTYHYMGSSFTGPVTDWFTEKMSGKQIAELFDAVDFDGCGELSFKGNIQKGEGVLANISSHSSLADFFKAVIESVTYPMYSLVSELKTKDIKCVRIGSGGSKAPKWNQFKSDLYGLPIEKVCNIEASSVGAAMLAAVGTGYYSSYEEAASKMVKVLERYEPNMAMHKRYHEIKNNR